MKRPIDIVLEIIAITSLVFMGGILLSMLWRDIMKKK